MMEHHEPPQHDRRSYDPRVMGLIERVDANVTKTDRIAEQLSDLARKFDRIEMKQDSSLKAVDDHELTLKSVNAFLLEMKMVHKSFDDFITKQSETNKMFMDSIKKSSDFQSKFIAVGGIVLILWQMFGAKLFGAVEVLVK